MAYMHLDEIEADDAAFRQREYEERLFDVMCAECGHQERASEKNLREDGWSLRKAGEICPQCNGKGLKKNEYWAVVDRNGAVMAWMLRDCRRDAIAEYLGWFWEETWEQAKRTHGVSVKKVHIEVIEDEK